MTTNEVVELLNAKRIGSCGWQARCPAHKDSSPSLRIREGDDGRVLLHCFAGCTTQEVVQALGLRIADLFSNAPFTPQQRAEYAAQREAREDEARKFRKWLIEPCDMERIWQNTADRLLDLHVEGPENHTVARLFHDALAEARRWNAEWQSREAQAKPNRLGGRNELAA